MSQLDTDLIENVETIANPAPLELGPVSSSGEGEWAESLRRVSKAVVSIKCRSTTIIDGKGGGSWQGTGFIVDKEKGLVLTNRHIIKRGPVRSKVIFNSKEEVRVDVVYRDPLHDFGIYKFDVNKVPKATFEDIEELELFPEGAAIGVQIRVVGNNSGEQLSILAGTLARLDRNAPVYSGIYRDYNTFYYGAASSTSGGSSGSPVVNKEGKAVALNAGGKNGTANSYYLPLERAVRALRLIQEGLAVERGTIQTTFTYSTFTQLRQFGLTSEEEEEVKAAAEKPITGLLQVEKIVPKGPGEVAGIEHRDILLKVNGKLIWTFVQFESEVDGCVEVERDFEEKGRESELFRRYVKENRMEGELVSESGNVQMKVRLEVRRGKERKSLLVEVDDLMKLDRMDYFSVAAGTIQASSYNIALWAEVPVGTVYIGTNSLFVRISSLPASGAFIKSVANVSKGRSKKEKEDVKDKWSGFVSLEGFINVLKESDHGDKLLIKYIYMGNKTRVRTVPGYFVMGFRPITRHFLTQSDVRKYDSETVKKYQPPTTAEEALIPLALREKTFLADKSEASVAKFVFSSLVFVRFHTSDSIDGGLFAATSAGVGCVIDKLNGFVITSRAAVPSTLGLAFLSIDSQVLIPAKIIYCHPTMNFTLLQFDSVELFDRSKTLAAKMTEVRLSDKKLKQHEKCFFYGLSSDEKQLKDTNCAVKYTARVNVNEGWPNYFRPRNWRYLVLDKSQNKAVGGVLCDAEGGVQAMFSKRESGNGKWSFDLHEVMEEFERIKQSVVDLQKKEEKNESAVVDDRLKFVFSEEEAATLQEKVSVSSFGVSLASKVISAVRDAYSLSTERVDLLTARMEEKGLDSKQVLFVARVMADSPAHELLHIGDLLLEINGEHMADVEDFQRVLQEMYKSEQSVATVVVQRDEEEVTLEVPLKEVGVFGTTRVVSFSGIIVQPTYFDALYEGFIPEEAQNGGVLVTAVVRGSAAAEYKMMKFVWILEVNDRKTPDLDSFLEVVKDIGVEQDVKFLTMTKKGDKKVCVIKTDPESVPLKIFQRHLTTLEWEVNEIN